ncbi:hypothetical protein KY289_015419 [Solanum tuberosum]|nr:hypothetical protein KY289_015419 [Solanum tuberosum]
MDRAVSNPNGKIWLLWSNEITGNIHENSEQHITGEFKHSDLTERLMVSFIYAKCKEHMRRPPWDTLLHYANMDIPWCTIGDFNVITNIEEKLVVMHYNMKSFEFISVIEACGLIDLSFTRLPFTWCNQRAAQARVWKRLDRSMVNDKWLKVMPQTTIEHLPSVGSDHSPLLMEMAMFTGQNCRIDERILQHLPTLVTLKKNQKLQEMPTLEELKQVVFAMNPNSAPGPDGIGGKFYQACWTIIKEDLLAVLVEKVSKKICGWQARILSFGGKITLAKHALQFLLGRDQDKRKYHWASLETMRLPCAKGGVGIRRLTDICTSLQYKQWWNFRAKSSLWGQFLKSKYCQRANPVAKKVDAGQSLVWRYMMKNKNKVEDHITWKIILEVVPFGGMIG